MHYEIMETNNKLSQFIKIYYLHIENGLHEHDTK